jgi:hypothetical protein
MDYAETLARWRANFWERIDQVRSLGFDDRFIRTWHYYLAYCEAGFRERQIGVNQLVLAKPLNHLRSEGAEVATAGPTGSKPVVRGF